MAPTNSDFGRLVAAWAQQVRTPRPSQPSQDASEPGWWPSTGGSSGFDSALQATPAEPQRVLVAAARGVASASAQALALRLGSLGAFRFGTAQAGNAAEFLRVLDAQRPRLLLLDVALAEACGIDALRHGRRVAPEVDWLLLWDAPSARGFELAIGCEARGCLEWQATVEHVERALRSVLAGELWFPRQAMQSLYFSLLAASQGVAPPTQALDVVGSAARPELTDREAEVMALMREGMTNQQIADRLDISINTVKKHLAHAFEKRGLHHRRQLR